ncbi:MAG: Gfo/Idh/MocA family oxidoreductase [Microthrixaceae bacterium]|nr:Gfo/Idh/MocA family oxidoreductase [Microthrixaceae bacterium]
MPSVVSSGGHDERLPCAVIGAGAWGRNLVVAVDQLLDLTAVATTGSDSSARWLNESMPRVSPPVDPSTVLGLGRNRAVVIATPAASHFEIAGRALDAGLHVFVEKPVCLDVAEATDLRRRALAYDLELFVGYVYLFDPYFEALTDLTAADGVRRVDARWNRPGLRGEILHELLPHDLALLMVLLGSPLSLRHVLVNDAQRLEIDLVTSRGVTASLRYTTDASRPRLKDLDVWSGDRRFRWSPGRLDEDPSPSDRSSPWHPVALPADLRLDHASTPVEREVARFAHNAAFPGDRMVQSMDLVVGVTSIVAMVTGA